MKSKEEKMKSKLVVVHRYCDRYNGKEFFLCGYCHTERNGLPVPPFYKHLGMFMYHTSKPAIMCALCGVDFSTLIPDIESPYESEAIDGVDLSSDAGKELDCTGLDRCLVD